MTNVSQPSSPAEFVAAGATPEQAALLHEQHEALAGRRGPDARAAMTVAAHDAPPPTAPPPTASPVTQATAVSALEAHEAAKLSAEMDKMFAPPASASDYRFPPTPESATDEGFAQEQAVKVAMHGEGIPRSVGENLATNILRNARTISSPAQADARLAANQHSLSRMYGADLQANLKVVDQFLDDAARRQPALQPLVTALRERPYLLDALDIDSLLQFATHRSARGR